MIVIDEPGGRLTLVRQADHAATSAQIAQAWRRPQSLHEDTWRRLIEAVGRHDDGWADAEQQPRLDDHGRPHDFKSIHTSDHVNIWMGSVDRARADDPYAALLIALHARWLYTHVEQDSIEDERVAQQFVNEINRQIDRLITALEKGTDQEQSAVRPDDLNAARRLLSFFDALSLALLGGIAWFNLTPVLQLANHKAQLSLQQSDPVRIDPWPFDGPHVDLFTVAIELGYQRFDSPDEVRTAMSDAEPVQLTWRLMPA